MASKLSAAIGLALLWTTPIQAQTYLGPGGLSCGAYMSETADSTKNMLDSYILGYVSGVGFLSSLAARQDMLKPYDRSDVIGYVRTYCRSNVSKTLLNTTNDFIYSLSKASR